MALSVLIMAAILGASVGSFLTLITYRLPRDEKIGMTRSRCPAWYTWTSRGPPRSLATMWRQR